MEEKLYDVPADLKGRAYVDEAKYRTMYEASLRDPEGFWGEHGRRIDWIEALHPRQEHHLRPRRGLDPLVRGRRHQRLRQLHRPAPRHPRRPGRDHLGRRRPVGLAKHHLPRAARGGLPDGERPAQPRRRQGRPGHDLPADDPGGRLRHAGLRPARGDPLGGLRRLLAGFARQPHRGLRLPHGHHRRRGPARRPQGARSRRTSTRRSTGSGRTPSTTSSWCAAREARSPCRPGRDVYYDEAAAQVTDECPAEPMNAEDPLFILFTSGSTGQPKGVLHTTGGYLVWASFTHQYVFDYHDGDVYWCTADVGWVTGHTYILYGPLANGATTLMFEGIPTYPSISRFWEVVDKHGVNIFYTAPTAIRSLMGAGEEPVRKTSRKSLRLLGSVGEPINPEAWEWYHRVVGDGRCPIVDTWWQTETGGILITPLPGATKLKPGSATLPFSGREARGGGRGGQRAVRCLRGQPLHRRFLARADAHRLRRPRALRADLLLHLPRQVFHRRRLPARRGRLLLDHRPRGRRHQRLRPPHGHGGGGIGPRRPSQGLGGRGGRLPARHQGPGHLRLRHPDDGGGGRRKACARSSSPGCGARSARSPRRT